MITRRMKTTAAETIIEIASIMREKPRRDHIVVFSFNNVIFAGSLEQGVDRVAMLGGFIAPYVDPENGARTVDSLAAALQNEGHEVDLTERVEVDAMPESATNIVY